MFPDAFPEPPKVDIEGTNKKYKGWDVRIKNIFFANGMREYSITWHNIHWLEIQLQVILGEMLPSLRKG